MSDLISRKQTIKALRAYAGRKHGAGHIELANGILKAVCLVEDKEEIPPVEAAPQWIPCGERLPEERDSLFKKFKGTDKWSPAMFEGISDDVNVTVEFEDGTRTTKASHTLDGKWKCEKDYGVKMKVIAWMPLPDPYKADMRKKV